MESKSKGLVAYKSGGNKKKWLIGSVVGVLVLGLLAVLMINIIFPRLMPDKYVLVSMGKMHQLAENETKGMSLSIPDNRRTSIDFKLKELQGGSAEAYKDIVQGLGLSLTLANSEEDHILIDAALKQNNTNLMDLSIYSTDQRLGLKIPGLLDQYLMVDLTKFKEKYDQSDFPTFLGPVAQEDVDLLNTSVRQLRTAIIGQPNTDDPAKEHRVIADEFEALTLAFIKDVKIKHTGLAKVMIGNKSKKANEFTVSVDAEILKGVIGDSFDIVFSNSTFMDTIPLDELDLSKTDIEKMFYDTLDQITFSDVDMVLLIDYKRRIVGIEMDTAMTLEGEKLNLWSTYYLSGAESIFDTMLADISLNADHESIQMTVETDKTYGSNKNKTSQDIRFKVKESETELFHSNINIEQDTKAVEDNFAIRADVTANEDISLKFRLSGDLVTHKGLKETSLKANEIALTLNDYGDQLTVTGSGAFSIEDLKDEHLTLTEAQELDLFSLNLSQMLDIIGRVGKEFYSIGNMMDQFY